MLVSTSAAQMIAGNRVMLLHDGAACLPAMFDAIAAARVEVLLEMYWFGSDSTGRRFAKLLADRAREGIRVCVTYDSVGSWEADRSMFEEMRSAGCEVQEFNPLRWWWPRWRISNRRNHRKILVVDGRLGMTGGVNLADQWASEADGGQNFRDDVVVIEGPAVASMREICLSALRGRKGIRALPATQVPAPCGEVRLRVLANSPRKNRRVIARAYLDAIRQARRRVMIENSYFIPDFFVRRALVRACRQGALVRVVLPHQSDVPAVAYATRKLYSLLLRHGFAIYEWSQSILHSKIAVVDDWCTVGTHNLDYRSWLYNYEINVIIEDAQVASALAARIERDIGCSVAVDAHAWRFRPLLDRLLEEFFYRFRRVL